jgi:hypothetical protein
MSQCRRFAALLVLFGLVAPVLGQAKDKPVELKWKFKEGQKFYQEISTVTKQEMTFSSQKITQTQSQTFYFSWLPESFDKKDKTWKVKQKIEGVKLEIEIGGQKITYDSTKDTTTSNPLSDFFKQLVDSEFTLTIGEDMKIKKIGGKDKFIEKLTKANNQMEPLLKEILSDEAFKQMADPTFAALPDQPVAKGATWDRETTLNMGPIGKYRIKNTYTYDGPDKDKNEVISVKSTLTYTKPDPGKAGQLPFKIENADLKSKKGTGKIVFDPKAGRVVSSTMDLDIGGNLDISIGGMTTKVELTQNQKTTVKTSDKPLLKKEDKEKK